jgi:hypothetical protein
MMITVQLKLELEQATKMNERLAEIRSRVRATGAALEAQLGKCIQAKEAVELRKLIAAVHKTELDCNMSNLLRGMLDWKLLDKPDKSIIVTIAKYGTIRGRPRRK